MKYIFNLLFLLSFFIQCYAQTVAISPTVKVTTISFFDKEFYKKVNTPNPAGWVSDCKCYELGNNIIYENGRLHNIKDRGYRELGVGGSRLLNDSILLTQEGFFDLYGSTMLQSTINEKNLKYYLKYDNQTIPDYEMIKSDIFPIRGKDDTLEVYNLLSNKATLLEKKYLGTFQDNPFSKYLFTNGLLINRYDITDMNLDIWNSDYFQFPKHYVLTYNDSTVFIPIAINQQSDYTKVNFNKILNISFDSLKTLIQLNVAKPNEVYNLGNTAYFFNKYNKLNIIDLISNNKITPSEVKKLESIYTSLHNGECEIIIEYNFQTKKIVSVLEKNSLPLVTINSIKIDKNNNFLIVSHNTARNDNINYRSRTSPSEITIFDLNTKQEVISFLGTTKQINPKNELIVNFRHKQGSNLFEYTRLNLNELKRYNSQKKLNSQFVNLNIDEFVTKEEFLSNISKNLESANNVLEPTNDKININGYENTKLIDYNSNYIKNYLTENLNHYFKNIQKILPTYTLSLNYDKYDATENKIYFNYIDFPVGYVGLDNIINSNLAFSRFDYKIFGLLNITPEEAKNLKNSECKLVFNAVMHKNLFPNLGSFLAFKYVKAAQLDPNAVIGISPPSVYYNECTFLVNNVPYKSVSWKLD